MGRASRKGAGGGGSPNGSRSSTTANPRPRPEQDSVVLGVMDECLVYYSPRVDKVLSTPADMEVVVDGSDFDPSHFDDEIAQAKSELLQQVRQNLSETGEIGAASFTRDIDFDVYDGPSHDRLEQRWSSSSATLEAFLSLDEKDTQVWEEDNVAAEISLLSEFRGPEADRVREALDQKAARQEAAIMKEELRRAQEEIREGQMADEPDASSRPESREEEARREKFEEERYAKQMRPLFEERAEEIAEDRDGKDWKSLSAEEQERRILEAEMIMADEEVARREDQGSY